MTHLSSKSTLSSDESAPATYLYNLFFNLPLFYSAFVSSLFLYLSTTTSAINLPLLFLRFSTLTSPLQFSPASLSPRSQALPSLPPLLFSSFSSLFHPPITPPFYSLKSSALLRFSSFSIRIPSRFLPPSFPRSPSQKPLFYHSTQANLAS